MNAIVNLRNKGFIVAELPYDGGTEYIIERSEKVVSVACSALGIIDILVYGDTAPLYTGTNQERAAAVVVRYFGR